MSTHTSPSTARTPQKWLAPRLLLLAVLLASLVLLPEAPALAASIVVTTANEGVADGDGCSLREAILNANADGQSGSAECNAGSGQDMITFDGDYTITLASTLPDVTSNLIILTSGQSITINGNNAVRVFTIQAGAALVLGRMSIISGSASQGGGIRNDGGALTLIVTTFSGNSASDAGGAIYNAAGTLTLRTSTFSGNSATNAAGAIYNATGTLTIDKSTFSANSAQFAGGIYNTGGTLTVTNSTFSGNTATENAGGILNDNTLTVSTSTFSANSAKVGGAINNYMGAMLNLRNTIMANSPSGGDCSNSGTIATNLATLIEDGSCSPALSGDPLLSPLGSYGGSAQTVALLPGSPAIDAGDSTTCAAQPNNNQDQRGVVRPVGVRCDIGAFESQGFSLGSLSGTPQSAAINTAFATPLGLIVSSASGEPVGPGGRVILSAPASGPSITASSPFTQTTSASGAVSQIVTANGLVGSYSVTASSRGATGPAVFSLTNIYPTSVTLVSSANPSTFGQNITFTATVIGAGTPTGQVEFVIDGGAPTLVTLINGQASFSTSALAVGTHAVVANYAGGQNHMPSSATLAGGQTVGMRRVYLPLISR